jgi:hypothetical protein
MTAAEAAMARLEAGPIAQGAGVRPVPVEAPAPRRRPGPSGSDGATGSRPSPGNRSRLGGNDPRLGGQGGLLKTLAVAASIALVAGPAFTFHRSTCLHLPAPRAGAAIAVGAAAVSLEPLLPSGLF